ncbi:MAG: Rrf2 family transcriptional regulator [Acidobacteria bacterium]|nr:Rrf2 family transcriptional regulator [Acidobacteriota bacterium]
MLFSPPCEHAIRALIFLAGRDDGAPVSVAVIAEKSDVPTQFLAKILLQLKNHRLLKSMKGPGGGYLLARTPDQIKLIDIASVFENPQRAHTQCVLGLDVCMDEHPCPLHNEWSRFRDTLDRQFREITLQQLSEKMDEKRAHISNMRLS